jgi:hypothetical protein
MPQFILLSSIVFILIMVNLVELAYLLIYYLVLRCTARYWLAWRKAVSVGRCEHEAIARSWRS